MGRRSGAARAAARKTGSQSEAPVSPKVVEAIEATNDDCPEAEPSESDLKWEQLSGKFVAVLQQLKELQADVSLAEANRHSLRVCHQQVESACLLALEYFVEANRQSRGQG